MVDDRFYVIKQAAAFGPPASGSYTKLTEANLSDVTANLIQQGTAAEQTAAAANLAARQGWYIQLEADGEKALAQAEILNDQIIFSTFTPAVSTTSCGGAVGAGAAYLVDLYDGRAVQNLDAAADDRDRDKLCGEDELACVKADRKRGLRRGGIPPGVVVFYPPSAGPEAFYGPENPFDIKSDPKVIRTYWREVIEENSP